MIHWLVQTKDAHPDLHRGVPPAGLLSEEETAVFNNFKFPKKRQDWLLGRWTVKQLLQQVILQEYDQAVPLEAMSVLAGEDGAPAAHFEAPYAKLSAQISISISHAHETAFCAAINKPDWPLGADLEWIEARPARFAAEYFTDNEQAFLKKMPSALREMQITALWSAKEAALKAVRQGLRFNTRHVECRFNVLENSPQEWAPFDIVWNRPSGSLLPALQGWWNATADYVLTLAVKGGEENYYAA